MKQTNERIVGKIILGSVVCIILFCFMLGAYFTVPAGHRGVLLTFGKPMPFAYDEGIHFKIPIAQKAVRMEVRTTKIETGADSSSRDLQDVSTTVALNFHVNPESSVSLYQEVGMDYVHRIINPAIQESVKAVSARYIAEELITKRAEVRTAMQEAIRPRLENYHLVVDDFNIVNFQFSEVFDGAIEAKVTAEQLKLKADRDLQRIQVEAQQKIEQAKAEAESLRLQKQEVTEDLIRLREIEAKMAAIDKWNGELPQVTGGAIPLLSIDQMQSVEVQE